MSISWDREAAAHLARRAGFGAAPAELDSLVNLGPDAAVDQLINYGAIDNSAFEADLLALILPTGIAPVYDLKTTTGLRKWFLHRMVFTKRPLEEKMTYFWNLHWTSGISKVQGVTLMLNQNQTERQYALGKFDDLVVAMSQDPAMLVWLDNATSRAGRPNENYARELMELFTLGVDNYTQTDVTEVARALTGWTLVAGSYTGTDNYNGAKFQDNPAIHDNGTKTILGQTGNWNGYDAIRIILDYTDAQGSVSGRFLSKKLWTYFAYHDPPDWVVAELAGVYVSSGRSIKAVVDHLLRMPEFYEPHARQTLVRSPVEYIVAALRQLEAKTDMSVPVNGLTTLGQFLFDPSDAKGPEGDMTWINTGTVFARASLTNAVATNRGIVGTRFDPAALLAGKTLATATDVVDALVDRFGLANVSPQTKAVWAKFVDSKSDGSRGFWQNTSSVFDQKVRGVIHLMLTSPDYNLC